jgi:hypothetical protein
MLLSFLIRLSKYSLLRELTSRGFEDCGQSHRAAIHNLYNIQCSRSCKGISSVTKFFVFRLTVIKALPQLQKLDNIQVSSEEMVRACSLETLPLRCELESQRSLRFLYESYTIYTTLSIISGINATPLQSN